MTKPGPKPAITAIAMLGDARYFSRRASTLRKQAARYDKLAAEARVRAKTLQFNADLGRPDGF